MRFFAASLMQFAHGRFAPGAFNVSNLGQFHRLFRGAARGVDPPELNAAIRWGIAKVTIGTEALPSRFWLGGFVARDYLPGSS